MFIHLNVKTDHSVMEGVGRVEEYLQRCIDHGMKALGIANKGGLQGSIHFYKKAMEEGIKPIVGMEFSTPWGSFVAYAKSEAGYFWLCDLASLKNISIEDLFKLEEIILISKFKNNFIDHQNSNEIAHKLLEKFGEDFFIEINNNAKDDMEEIEKHAKFAHINKIPLMASGNVHYVEKSDTKLLKFINRIKNRGEGSLKSFSNEEDLSFRSCEEMEKLFNGYKEAIKNCELICDRCNLNLTRKELIFPHIENGEEELTKLVKDKVKGKYGKGEVVNERVEKELSIICKKGFASYFLVVSDIVKHAKERGIAVGPGRGSAAASIVAYLLGITNVDPMKYDLIFERFLNSKRIKAPDIDIDIANDRIEEVIDYVRTKYGALNISTFNRMTIKSLLKEAENLFEIDFQIFGDEKNITNDIINKRKKELSSKNPEIVEILESIQRLAGNVRSISTHAAGLIFKDGELKVPTFNGLVAQYDMFELEYLGFHKVDLLSLKQLSFLTKVIEKIESKKIELENIPLDDEKSYSLLAGGNTKHIFQMESKMATTILKAIRPEKIEDLALCLALNRPGPLKIYGQDSWAKDRDEILIYQEQIMMLASEYGGFDLEDSEILVRAISKKDEKLMEEFKIGFLKKAKDLGRDEKETREIYSKIEAFASYSFNKAHAISYAVISYHCAYLKANYPLQYLATLLDDDLSKLESLKGRFKIYPPDINFSAYGSRVFSNFILLGLGALKNISKNAIKEILEERDKGGFFNDFNDFTERINLNKELLKSMVHSGTFGSLEANKIAILNEVDEGDSLLLFRRPKAPLTISEEREKEKLSLRTFLTSYPLGNSGIVREIGETYMKVAMEKNILTLSKIEEVKVGDVVDIKRGEIIKSSFENSISSKAILVAHAKGEVDNKDLIKEILINHSGGSRFAIFDGTTKISKKYHIKITKKLIDALSPYFKHLEIVIK